MGLIRINLYSEGHSSLNLSASTACPLVADATARYSVMQFSSMSLLVLVYSMMVSLEALDNRLFATLYESFIIVLAKLSLH